MKRIFSVLMILQLFFPLTSFAATQINNDASSLLCFPFMFIIPVFYIFFWILIMAISLGGFVLWVLMLIDLMKRDVKDFPPGQSDPKLIWLLLILLTSYLGALIYYIMVYKKHGKAK